MQEQNCGPVVAVGAVIWKNDAVLLIRRGHAPGLGLWSLPGGHQKLGETVYQAAEREIREETSVSIDIIGIAGVVDLIDRDGETIRYHYTVIDVVAEWSDGQAVAGDDAAEVAWVRPERFPDYCLTDAVLAVIATAADKRHLLKNSNSRE
jgi:ADP-ribose pyrophosphatase YjhB (NUDIX family)